MFETARALKIPVAWNLAGGYQQPLRKVLDVHDNTMRACAAVYLGGGTTDRSRIGNVAHQKATHVLRTGVPSIEETKAIMETPPLSRAGRRSADATLAAAHFKATVDGERVIRKFEVHGMAVTECVDVEEAAEGRRKSK